MIAAPALAVIQNPLGGANLTVDVLIGRVITWLLGLAALLALLALVWGGMKIILGFTDEENVKEGKKIIKWAIIGIVIVACAYGILATVTGLLGINA